MALCSRCNACISWKTKSRANVNSFNEYDTRLHRHRFRIYPFFDRSSVFFVALSGDAFVVSFDFCQIFSMWKLLWLLVPLLHSLSARSFDLRFRKYSHGSQMHSKRMAHPEWIIKNVGPIFNDSVKFKFSLF